MQPRMQQPAMVLPEALRALLALSKSAKEAGVPLETAYLVHLRASQINGCSYCVEMHAKELTRPARATSGSGAWRLARRRTSTIAEAPRLPSPGARIADAAEPVPDAIGPSDSPLRRAGARGALIEISAINVEPAQRRDATAAGGAAAAADPPGPASAASRLGEDVDASLRRLADDPQLLALARELGRGVAVDVGRVAHLGASHSEPAW